MLTAVFAAAQPVVAGISPIEGPAAGGTEVTISGESFTGATEVNFGATEASSFTVENDGEIIATSPAGTPEETVDVTVTGPGGTSATSAADQFTYEPAPSGHTVTLKIEGSGSGEVVPIGATYQGTPPINCTYTAPGPEAGDCVVEMSDEGEEYEQVLMKAIAAPARRIRRMETGSRQLRSLRHPQRHLSRRRILRPLRRRRR